MKDTFNRLSHEKKENLIHACKVEFSQFLYNEASLNNIIKRAKISKGGLFRYIHDKKDLYLFIVNQIIEELVTYQVENINFQERCFFQRYSELARLGIDYYKEHCLEYKVILMAFYDLASPCYGDVLDLRELHIGKYQLDLINGVDWSQYKESKENILKITKYMIDGYNIRFLSLLDSGTSIEEFQKFLESDLDLIMNSLKSAAKGGENA